ncbi:MAG: HD domain-containing protein [Deltaproteobacteria bacterium]|nr:HD domain-containing protein [Deltaproteobacteria bacterium]
MTLFLVGDELVVENRSILGSGQSVEKFVKILREKGVERITFSQEVTPEELQALVGDLASREGESVRGWPGITLGRVQVRVAVEGAGEGMNCESKECEEILDTLSGMDEKEIERIKELYLLAEGRKQISIHGVDDSVRKLISEIRRNLNPLSLLATVKCTDEYTFTHVVNVCILTLIQAEKLGFGGRQLYDIGMASLLHDVGKTFIPEEILSKPGALTSDERALIETHPVKGGRYLLEVGGMPKVAVLAAMEHHLRFDGSGYPKLSPGWKPHIVAQMITIADVFDALRSRRPYSAPKPMEEIVKILNKEKGTTFNPYLVRNFLEIIAPTTVDSHAVAEGDVRRPGLAGTCDANVAPTEEGSL